MGREKNSLDERSEMQRPTFSVLFFYYDAKRKGDATKNELIVLSGTVPW